MAESGTCCKVLLCTGLNTKGRLRGVRFERLKGLGSVGFEGLAQWDFRAMKKAPVVGGLFHFKPSIPQTCPQSIWGSMIAANAVRARFRRDFTVPRLQSVISAISSYDLPSSSRSTNTWR